MAITKAEIITALDDGVSTAIDNLNSIMSTGDISNETDKVRMAVYLTNITRLSNAKIWVEANL